jgi:WD40 repeat protein
MSKLSLSISLIYSSSSSTDLEYTVIPTIIRFCGTSNFCLTGIQLIRSISIQLLAAHNKSQQLESFFAALPTQSYKTAVQYFQNLISEYPVFLFIDSLDQLANHNEERSKLNFLSGIRPHELSRIIVSTLPDEYDENGKAGNYFYQCEKVLRSDSVSVIDVGMIHQVESTIRSLLSLRHRKLTNDQWIVTLNATSHEPSILYINLAMEVISHWRSYESEVHLKPTVKGLIHQIFQGLEKIHGEEFTSMVFAFITFSREGINDREMQDLLSLHEGVMNEICQYSSLHYFPIHVWLRLKYVIKNLVVEKESHCLKWYHRQLCETATERYSNPKSKECREIMGRYFCNLYDASIMQEKNILDQPLVLNGIPVWKLESIENKRRIFEGYYHLIKGGLLKEAVEEVCSLEFVCCSSLSGDLSQYIRQVKELIHLLNGEVPLKLDHYFRWIRKKATRIISNPRLDVRLSGGEEPRISSVYQDVQSLYEREGKEYGQSLGASTLGFNESFDAIEMELIGHDQAVRSVGCHFDNTIISAGGSKTIIWDGETGEMLKTLEDVSVVHENGDFGIVGPVACSQDGNRIVTVSSFAEPGETLRKHTIKIWDAVNGEFQLKTLEPFDSDDISLACNHDGSKIVIRSKKIIQIWDTMSGDLLKQIEDDSVEVSMLAWSHNSSRIISGSGERSIKIWDSNNGAFLGSLEGHSEEVTIVVWNHDDSKILSGSEDRTIIIWDGETGELLKSLQGHSYSITSLDWNHDDSKIVSAALYCSIKIWDGETGTLLNTLLDDENLTVSVSWNHDSTKIIAGTMDGVIKIWNANSEALGTSLHVHHPISSNSSDDNLIVTSSTDNTVNIWDRTTGKIWKTFPTSASEGVTVSWNRNETKLAVGNGNTKVKIWEVATGELLTSFESNCFVTYISWNPNGNELLVLGIEDLTFEVRSGVTGQLLKALKGHSGSVVSGAWNHTGNKIATGSADKSIKIWEITTGAVLRTLEGHSHRVTSVVWNHNDSKIVSGSADCSIKIWDALEGKLLNTLTGHSLRVCCVAWNHDSSKILSGSFDGTIKIWDDRTGSLLQTLGRFHSAVYSASWKSNDTEITFSSDDLFLRSWRVV